MLENKKDNETLKPIVYARIEARRYNVGEYSTDELLEPNKPYLVIVDISSVKENGRVIFGLKEEGDAYFLPDRTFDIKDIEYRWLRWELPPRAVAFRVGFYLLDPAIVSLLVVPYAYDQNPSASCWYIVDTFTGVGTKI